MNKKKVERKNLKKKKKKINIKFKKNNNKKILNIINIIKN